MALFSAFFTQTRFPRLWELFQQMIGGATDKRRICLDLAAGRRRILEVGCATGSIAAAFAALADVEYTGVDLDPSALRLARRRFAALARFSFHEGDFRAFAASAEDRFDLVLLAGVLHHVDDASVREFVIAAAQLLAPDGAVGVVDPVLPEPGDPWLVRRYWRLDQGGHIRSAAALRGLLSAARDLEIASSETRWVGATPWGWPRCARFLSATMRPAEGHRVGA